VVNPSVSATIFFDAEGVVFVRCSHVVFGSADQLCWSVPAWLAQKKTRWLPPYIRLLSDEHGVPIYPKLHVTALVERRQVWERLVKMDGVTRSTVMGKLCLPRFDWHLLPPYLPNHKSWEVGAVKAKLGTKMVAYFCQGVLEFVLPGYRLPALTFVEPTFVELQGAVPKKGPDEFRAIDDSRHGNKTLVDWGPVLHGARPSHGPHVAGHRRWSGHK
jgi:hypothetical protein